MHLKAKDIDFSTGGPLVVLINHRDAKKLNIIAQDRIKLKYKNKEIVAAIDIAESDKTISPGKIGIFEELITILKVKNNEKINVSLAEKPKSVDYIHNKLNNEKLNKKEIYSIIEDIVLNKLTDIEMTYFVSAAYLNKLTPEETYHLTKAISFFGEKLNLKKKVLVDKHCIGGVPNNRTSMIIVPIIAAAGLPIMKSSSRAITSAAGTADTLETLCKVNFTHKEILKLMKKTNAALVWGGNLNLAGADDKLIRIRHPLNLDPKGMLISSILAKKKAAGSTHVLIDIPIGKFAKIKTKKEARELARHFIFLGKKLRIKIKVLISNGSCPIGSGIGPNLEARDVLYILKRDKRAPKDLEKKSVKMAQIMFNMTKTKASAQEILDSGLAYKKFKEILKNQKGNPNINPDKLKNGKYSYKLKINKKTCLNNKVLSKVARILGSPNDKEAGIDIIDKQELILYSNNPDKLKEAKKRIKNAATKYIK